MKLGLFWWLAPYLAFQCVSFAAPTKETTYLLPLNCSELLPDNTPFLSYLESVAKGQVITDKTLSQKIFRILALRDKLNQASGLFEGPNPIDTVIRRTLCYYRQQKDALQPVPYFDPKILSFLKENIRELEKKVEAVIVECQYQVLNRERLAQKAQQEEEIQEELAKLQEWVNAPLLEKLSAKELLELQEAFARTPDNSTNLPESLSQMPAQDVLPPQQKREAQATEAAVKQAEEQERIEAERTEQSKREAAQKEAALQAKKEQIERAARIKLYQQKQAAEEEAKRVQEAEQKGQAAAASAKTASNIVTLADVKIRYTNLLGLPEQFDDTDRKIIIADLSTRDLQAMDTSQLGTVINQYDMKKPGALAYFVIGKVGQRVISKTYKMVSQQLVEPQEKANCGWQSVVNAIAVMKNHKGESFD
ncbi:hypothetical protein EBR03_05540, partial [bacterium]|nr:hypothetical protein [bacterium]